jgi:hypothetical protein
MEINLTSFLAGKSLLGIQINDLKEDIKKKLGSPIEIAGEKNYGFIYYPNGIRYSYLDNQINELTILFEVKDSLVLKIENKFGEQLEISKRIQIHEFIYLLNSTGVIWKCVDQKDLSTFMIVINNNVGIYFNLDSGGLNRISVGRR